MKAAFASHLPVGVCFCHIDFYTVAQGIAGFTNWIVGQEQTGIW